MRIPALFGTVAGVAVAGVLAGLGSAGTAAASTSTPSVAGVIRTVAADGLGNGSDTYRQVLETPTATYLLRSGTPTALADVPANTTVRVAGSLHGSTLTAASVTRTGTAAARTSGAASAGSTGSSLPTTGTTRLLVMLAEWSGADTVTQASATAQVFTDTNNWYRDSSYGQLGQSGDVTPWMHITGPAGNQCFSDMGSVMAQAKAAASVAGYDIGSYSNFMVYFPHANTIGSDCGGYSGWAYQGAPNVWVNGAMNRRTTTHEQGHNYGLDHAHAYMCSKVVTGDCDFSAYGDTWSAMGSSGYAAQFNADEKTRLGWMDGRSADLSTGGTATLSPLESTAGTSSVAVRASAARTYYLEYRQPVAGDSALPTTATNGVLVHVADRAISAATGTPDTGSNLLDLRPADGLSPTTATLRGGARWTSPEGVTISVGAVGAGGAQVSVTRPSTAVTVQETSSRISYTGTWSRQSDARYDGGATGRAAAASDTASFSFAGTAVRWITSRGPTQGTAQIWVDGVNRATVDLHADGARYKVVGWSGTVPAGSHTIEVRLTQNKRVNVDAFVYTA